MITLITGGIKSGKSAHALKLMQTAMGGPVKKGVFIATADPDDKSMGNKIRAHQKEREGLSLITIEEKIHLDEKIQSLDSSTNVIIIDCLTLWMGNLLYFMEHKDIRDNKINSFIQALKNTKIPCFIITNEVGLGTIPENKLARLYQDELGILNNKIAQLASSVFFMVSGIPMKIKP